MSSVEHQHPAGHHGSHCARRIAVRSAVLLALLAVLPSLLAPAAALPGEDGQVATPASAPRPPAPHAPLTAHAQPGSSAHPAAPARPAAPSSGFPSHLVTALRTYETQAFAPGNARPAPASPPAPAADGTPVVQVEGAQWAWPLGGAHMVVRPFEAPPHRYGPGHRGADLAGAGEVLAVADGTVRFRGSVAGRPVISIRHPNGIISTYEPVRSDLSAGDTVRAGQVIGELVMPGDPSLSHCAPALCLHLGARRGEKYLDPLVLLGARGPSVLLPLGSHAVGAGTARGSRR